MKSNLINRRKKAAVLVSPETLRMAIQEGRSIIPTFQSKKDPRLAQLMKAVQWLERVEASPMGKTNLDDRAYPQYAQTVKQYVQWVSQLATGFRKETELEQTDVPEPASQVASAGADPWVTDRDEKAEAKMPEKAEVPRLAAQKKIAQPGIPPGAPPPPGAGAKAPAAAPAATPAPAAAGAAPAPIKQAPPITQAGNGDINADIHQMSSETLANIISAISKNVEINDKAGLDLVEALAKQLKGRPVETQAPAARAASAKVALSLFDDSKVALYTPGFDGPGEGPIHDAPDPGVPKCHQCNMSNINGINCHETGCPNEQKDWNPETQEWESEDMNMESLCMASLNLASEEKEASSKVAVTPPGISEETAHEIKDEYPGEKDKAYATMWAIHNKKNKKGTLRETLADLHKEIDAYVLKQAAGSEGSSWFVEDQDTMDVKEGDKNVKEIAEAHGLEHEGPAKLDRPETTLPITLNGSKNAAEEMSASKALKQVEKLSEKLKEMYLDAKEITIANDSRQVREAVEAIYRAYDQLGAAAKVLGKQQMQEEAEEEALKVKDKGGKKKGSLLDGLVLASDDEEERCEGCGKVLSGSETEFCGQCAKKQRKESPKGKLKE